MPATTSKNVIHLLGQPVTTEFGKAAEAITPGMLTRGVETLNKHNAADTVDVVAIALEREEMGRGIDDAYVIGDVVKIGAYKPGSRFLGILANGQTVVQGDFLSSNGDGMLKIALSAAVAIGRSLETIAATVPAGARIRVEVV